mmetsp:Transcript_102712/g.287879  ORF Transcript_102712/g.287879 Transcript_102712/m.287879 type:complete len:150 (+) Transcript_102712:76-525(+)
MTVGGLSAPVGGPHPVQRLGRGTFMSHHAPCRPAADPERAICPGRAWQSYGQWFEAHLPLSNQPDVTDFTRSSTFWPYGQGVTVVTSSIKGDAQYSLDSRLVRNSVPHRPQAQLSRSGASSPVLRRAGSASALFGGHAESCVATGTRRM